MRRILAAALALQSPVTIVHKGVSCLAADVYPRLEACLDPAAEVARARVQFRAVGTPHWYFVDMKAEGACHRGTLPRPLESTTAVEYYVEAVSRSFLQTRTGEYRPRVAASREQCGTEPMPTAVGSATVTVGAAAAGAPALPPGFSANGLVAAAAGASVAAPVASAPAHKASPAGSPSPEAAPPGGGGGGGFPTRLAVVAGVLAVGGGAAAYAATRGEDLLKVDNDGDGFTEEQGDCNDTDPSIKPDGGFDFRVEFAYGNGSVVNCAARNAAQQNYRLTNNACETLVVERLSFAQTVAAPCTGSNNGTLALAADRVGPGETVTIRQGAAPGTVAPLCCPAYPCNQQPCIFNIIYTLVTSAGNRDRTNTYVVTDGTGRDCALCGSISTDELFRGAPRAQTPQGEH
jgi:hypothetical protein